LFLYILLAILIFGLLIAAHELGHFLAAKAVGVRVNEFSICMGPVLWQSTKGETTYSLRAIPIGGYCAMEGEDEESDDPRAFSSASPWRRLLILVAGSAANFLVGFLIVLILYLSAAGFTTTRIAGFFDGSPVPAETGLAVGDELYRIDGERVYLYSDIAMLLGRNDSGVYDLEVRRAGRIVPLDQVPLTPREYKEGGETVLRYGLYFSGEEKTVPGAIRAAWNTARDFARLVRLGLQDLARGAVGIGELSGPVGIVSTIAETGQASETTSQAVRNIAYLAAFLAVNLAVMNLLPLPALDGGRVLFLLLTALAEAVTRRKISRKAEGYLHTAGMILLLAFMAFITFKDIWKLLG